MFLAKIKMCFHNLLQISLSPIKSKSITYSGQQLRDINNNVKHDKLYLRLNPGTIQKKQGMQNKQMEGDNINKASTQTQKYKYPKLNNSQDNRLWRHCYYTIP